MHPPVCHPALPVTHTTPIQTYLRSYWENGIGMMGLKNHSRASRTSSRLLDIQTFSRRTWPRPTGSRLTHIYAEIPGARVTVRMMREAGRMSGLMETGFKHQSR